MNIIKNIKKSQKIDTKHVFTNITSNLPTLCVVLVALLGFYSFLQFEAQKEVSEKLSEQARSSAEGNEKFVRGAFSFSDSLQNEREIRKKQIGTKKRVVLSENSQASEEKIDPKNDRFSDFSRSLPGKTLSDLPALHPRLVSVCTCESSYTGDARGVPRQFDPDGSIRKNLTGTNDVGMCQINEPIHGEAARSLGYDIYTKQGNIDFANWLYRREGRAPWSASEHCWG